MKLSFLKLVLATGLLSVPALAWNNAGHGTIGVIAYDQLSPAARQAAVDILSHHPHFKKYLVAGLGDNPDLKSEAVQRHIFKQVATWADWVRPGALQPDQSVSAYHHSNWHYINYPYLRKQDVAAFPALSPKVAIGDGLVLEKIAECERVVADKKTAPEERAVMLGWYFHMVGDIHQPLHAAALVTPELPTGDRGGNDVTVQLEPDDKKDEVVAKKAAARPIWLLHSYWDGIIGESFEDDAIAKLAKSIEKEQSAALKDAPKHMSAATWAEESYQLAIKNAYLDGALKYGPPMPRREDPALDPAKVPELPNGYRAAAVATAHLRAAQAGARLGAGIEKMVK